jgi:hypothetical protein
VPLRPQDELALGRNAAKASKNYLMEEKFEEFVNDGQGRRRE